MEFNFISWTKWAEGIARLQLDVPQRLNAYSSAMCGEVLRALDQFERDDSLRTLVLTGSGRGFCSGGDLASEEELAEGHNRTLGHGAVLREGIHRVILRLRGLEKPSIAMVNGPAVAGGLALALACDLRIASDRATLGDTSGRAALLPDEGGAWLFVRAMGLERALRMTLLAETYDAETALRLGLTGEVIAHDQLENHVLELATQLSAMSPLAVRLAKRLMVDSTEQSLDACLRATEVAVATMNESDDAREGIAAFLDKRTPHFTGQ